MKCLAKDRHNDNCRNHIIQDSRFCKYHQYMNAYDDTMLSKLELCSSCLKMYYFEGSAKICEKCTNRGIANRQKARENKILCIKSGCTFKRSVENAYCGKHQLCVFQDETHNMNMKTCFNVIRGCRSQLAMDYPYSKCEICLAYERNKDNAMRNEVKKLNETNPSDDMKYCNTCCKNLPFEFFIGCKNKITKTCEKCRENNHTQDLLRDKEHRNELTRNSIKEKYRCYIKDCPKRNLIFTLSYNEFVSITQTPCYYCSILQNRGFNGIDRIDSKKGYILENCVSCCQMCNYMKGSIGYSIFISRIEHILTYQQRIVGNLHPECFANHIRGSYNNYKHSAAYRNLEFALSNEEYENIADEPCYICGKQNNGLHQNGIDRFDNSQGYIMTNVKACCGECNFMKSDYEFDKMIDKCELIYQTHENSRHIVSENTCCNYIAKRKNI